MYSADPCCLVLIKAVSEGNKQNVGIHSFKCRQQTKTHWGHVKALHDVSRKVVKPAMLRLQESDYLL